MRLVLILVATPAAAAPYREPDDWKRESGITADLGAGYSGLTALAGNHSGIGADTKAIHLDGAIGAFLAPGLATQLRVSLARPVVDTGPQVTAGAITLGLRTDIPNTGLYSFIGLGLAVGIDHMTSDSHYGTAWDWRFGIKLPSATEHTLTISVGLTLGKYGDGWLSDYGIALGYQHR